MSRSPEGSPPGLPASVLAHERQFEFPGGFTGVFRIVGTGASAEDEAMFDRLRAKLGSGHRLKPLELHVEWSPSEPSFVGAPHREALRFAIAYARA